MEIEKDEDLEIEYLSSAEFDITEGIKDLVSNIKSMLVGKYAHLTGYNLIRLK